MKCIHCEGQMKKDVAPFHIDRKGYHLSLDAVPAWVCGQCGEPRRIFKASPAVGY